MAGIKKSDVELFKKAFAIVESPEWFALGKHTKEAARAVVHYLATLEANGDLKVWRGIDPTKLDEERRMVAAHNAKLQADDRPARVMHPVSGIDADPIEAGRKRAMLQRGGPSALFNPQS